MIHVKPIDNFVVLHPQSFARIPAEGMNVADASYWHRRAKEGAVIISPAKSDAIAATNKPQSQEKE